MDEMVIIRPCLGGGHGPLKWNIDPLKVNFKWRLRAISFQSVAEDRFRNEEGAMVGGIVFRFGPRDGGGGVREAKCACSPGFEPE